MDIYSFINSRDIAEHCRSIGHEFTPLEMAFIVYLSDKTLSERHGAWQWIIDTQPDMEIPERRNCSHYDSLHQFLRDYLALENRIKDSFEADEPDALYTYKSYYTSKYSEPYECDTLFPTLDAVFGAIKKEKENEDIDKFQISRRWIGEEYKKIVAYVDCGGAIRVIDNVILKEFIETNHRYESFDCMWIEVPTPFKTGDVVIQKNTWKSEPFVLDYLCYWPRGERFTKEFIEQRSKDWDTTDMTAYGYGVSEAGHIYREDSRYYLDLEYYRGELKGKERTLIALSNYIKEKREISENLLLNAYEVILREEYIQTQKQYLGYVDELLEMAGLIPSEADESKPPEPTEEHTDIYSFIPSRDIAAHCRALGHEFTPLEQAVIIYHSQKPLAERHKAWKKIIDKQPDMKVTEWCGKKHGERIHYESLHKLLTETDDVITDVLEDVNIFVPVPFNKGDILTYSDNNPFVLTDEEWEYGKSHCPDERQYLAGGSIMDAIHSYSMRENGSIYYDFNPAKLELEYYRGELSGLNRVLKAISNHMKEEIPADLMMNAYDIIIHEEQGKDLRGDLCYYTDEGLALAGLENHINTDSDG